MNILFRSRQSAGFSLLEVLVAVVILSFGLLALASLQMGLIRSSSETKAQTLAMALTKERIENLESYESLGGADSACVSPYKNTANTCYRAITDQADTDLISIGGTQFSRTFSVARYVYDKSTLNYVSRADTALDSAILAASATSLPGKEFKRIVVTTSWTDASGVAQNVQLEDAISALDPGDSLPVTKTNLSASPRKAIAIITNPGSVAGVIPIAIGNGTDTAATNPRPVIVSQGQNSTAVETRFDIYTYAGLTSTTAQAQSRVETAVVGCSCSMSSGTETGYRPTYWDGIKYVVPVTSSSMPVSTATTGVTQSDICTACCRDHHDPVGVAGEKYDPRRATHNHYLSTDLTRVVTSGPYSEACRAIRVNGIFRIAADPYDDHFGLLATAGLSGSAPTTTITDAVPAKGAGSVTELYQNFVLNYLKARFVNSTSYNTETDPSSVSGYSALQSPSTAYIANASAPQYLHARGLYIDYLSSDALAAVQKAKSDCSSCDAASLQTAVLKLLPFTSINLSELGSWTSSVTTKLTVSDYGFVTTLGDPLPVKGKVTIANGANTGDQVNGVSTIQRSSAGLAVTGKVFPSSELTNNALTDSQLFQIGSGSTGGTSGDQFFVALNGLLNIITLANPAEVTYTLTTNQTCNKNSTTITPYTCTPSSGSAALPSNIPIIVGNYNRAFGTTNGKQVSDSCTNTSNDTTLMPYQITFDVASASPSGTAVPRTPSVNDGAVGTIASNGEYTIIDVNPVANGSTITINFGNPTYKCPSNWATFINNNGGDASPLPDSSNGSTVCIGNGRQDPAWSSTFVACPGGLFP